LLEVKKGGKIDNVGDRSVETISSKTKTVTLSAYNRFVQEHAPIVRQQLESSCTARNNSITGKITKVLQSDVMKECARLWKKLQQKQEENTVVIKKLKAA
jgi:hypothetical protein